MRALCILLLAAAGACAPRDAGFSDVSTLVRERTGARVRWSRDADVSHGLSRDVRGLLAQPLDADSAARVALLNNAELAASFEELGVARASLVGASLLPNLRLEGSYRLPDGAHGAEYEAGAAISLIDLLLLPQRRAVASSELEASKLRTAARALDLVLDVRRTFHDYLAAEQEAELMETVLSAQAAAFEVAQRLHAAGNITDLEHAQEQALYEDARAQLAEARLRSRRLRERLHALMGLWGMRATWRSSRRLPDLPARDDLPLAELEPRALERSIDLTALRREYEAASARTSLAAAQGWAPDLSIGVAGESEDGDFHYGPAIELTLPLFDHGQAATGRARARTRAAERRYAAAAVRLRAAARTAREELLTARERVIHQRDVVLPLRTRIVEQTQLQYNAMLAGVFQLLQARRDQVEAGRQYIRLLRRYWVARAAVESLLAGRLAELDEPGFGGETMDGDEDGEEPGAPGRRGGH